ncbi:MAG: DeoR/GlpR transcriptional regulator, partial [Lachnospiraceae bacterium]|nr:DeoR/GlpR transcriptional regulator [Candidatus Equihabitans merdae]
VGGQYNPATAAFFGPETIDAFRSIPITKAFLCCSGLSLYGGLSNETYYDPIIKRIVIDRSLVKILVTDTSKFNVNATRIVCPLGDMDVLVTNDKPSQDYIDYCQENDVQLLY